MNACHDRADERPLNDETRNKATPALETVPSQSRKAAASTSEQASTVSNAAPAVGKAKLKRRHSAMVVSFVLIVLLPTLATGGYLYLRAHDRFVSHVAFSVRSESTSSAMEMLGGIAEISGSSSSDTDILYNFIKSEEMVRALDQRLDLRGMWARAGQNWWDMVDDPWYAYHPPGTIEDLTSYWGRMVMVFSDSGTGLIDVEAQAFTPKDAHALTQAIFEESSRMINRLSQIAREDKIRYARIELEASVERLKTARAALTKFRNDNQIVDPQSLIEGQVGLLSSLLQQQAQALIELDTLRQTTSAGDPRMNSAERRVDVIANRINEERKKLGLSGQTISGVAGETTNYANIVGDYESLAVDQQFAEQSYTAALTAFDTAQAEAARQSRYLAAHIRPSMPERSTAPDRGTLMAFIVLILSMVWVLLVLVGYALRDRR